MEELDLLFQLQCLDLTLEANEKKLREINSPPPSAKIASEKLSEFQSKEKEFKELKREIKDRELEIESISQKVKKLKTELYSGKSGVKELMDKQAELEALAKNQKKMEDILLELLEKAEVLEIETQKAKQELDLAEKERDADLILKAKEKEEVEREIEKLKGEREEKVRLLPSDLLNTYERLRRTMMGKAVVEVKKDKCGGCQIQIANRKLSEIKKRNSIITCENCGRILYWKE
ncbi:MAG: C4-type zinc ribbon domain-containing protein [Caldiserica bacterium]|jgi:predicted  nucleic acid-binding Zn-ribbon protein|nr:C4-type zinc ribbon domain-containing protein [Caldisericota bacterium]MDH7561934.1 C4-type zinc ribbon domain-containing protein [Caldisericota bacterium]